MEGIFCVTNHSTAVKTDPTLGVRAPFAALDADKDDAVMAAELTRATQPRLDAILKAVEDRNDDLLWKALLNLSSAYLLDGWQGPPNYQRLLEVASRSPSTMVSWMARPRSKGFAKQRPHF